MRIVAVVKDVGKLAFSKVAPVFVSLVFVPYYNRHFSAQEFGFISTVLALQGFAALMDFGSSVIMLRMVSSVGNDEIPASVVRAFKLIEYAVLLIYTIIGIILTIVLLKFHSGYIEALIAFAVLAIFLSIALQGVYFNVQLGKGHVAKAAFYQSFSSIGRGVGGFMSVALFGPQLLHFFISQLVISLIVCISARKSLWKNIFRASHATEIVIGTSFWSELRHVFSGGSYLMLISMAGAAALYLDKVIISYFYGAENLGAYYLAWLYCTMPVSLIAGPIYQFFQPKIIALSAKRDINAVVVSRNFLITLFISIVIVGFVLVCFKEFILGLWLRGADNTFLVSRYIDMLFPGFAIGALGFFPYALLVCAEDFRFHALTSTANSFVALLGVLVMAVNRFDLIWICALYGVYNFMSVLVPWVRAVVNRRTRAMATCVLPPG